MSFAEKHNKGGIDWGINTEGFEYIDRKDLFDLVGPDYSFVLKGLFINRNKTEKELKEYGPSIVAILEDKFMNLPSHMLEEVEAILADPEDIETIKAGKVGFTLRKYESHGKDCYGVRWVDIQ